MNYVSRLHHKRSQWWHYISSLVVVTLAILIKLLLSPIINQESPFMLFFFAILASAWYSGKKAGFFVTVIAAIASNFFFIYPYYSFKLNGLSDYLRLGLFIIEGCAIAFVVAELNTVKRQVRLVREEALRCRQNLQQAEECFRLFVEAVRERAIFKLNPDARIASWNAGAENLFGYKEADIVGQHFSCIFTSEDITSGKPQQELRKAIALGQTEEQCWQRRQDGTLFWANCIITALRDETGALRGFCKLISDFTEHRQAEVALQKAKDKLESRVLNRTVELINANNKLQFEIIERQQTEQALLDSQIRLQLINSISTAMMLGMSVEQILERTVRQLHDYFPSLRISYSVIDTEDKLTVIHSLEPEGNVSIKGLEIDLTAAGEYLSALRMNAPVVIEDVTTDSLLVPLVDALLANGTGAFLSIPFQDLDNIVNPLSFASPTHRKWSEHELATLIVIAQYLTSIMKKERFQQERDRAKKALQEAKDELEIRVKNRTAQLAMANEELTLEINERKRAEAALRESEERLRFALDAADMVAWEWNTLTDEVSQSQNADIYGLTPNTTHIPAAEFFSMIHPEDRSLVIATLQKCILQRTDFSSEFRIIRGDGSVRWMADKGKVIYDTSDKAARIIGVIRDITEQKQVADQIKASLVEKEVLLKEIHHRVKNNLQIISSLLSLQSGYIADSQTLELLKAGENRIASMALIHEQLYQSVDLAKINFKEYIQNLAANLFSSYNVDSEKIILQLNIEDVFLCLDIAIPCGIIINELISNSLKYAFPDGRFGQVNIELYAEDNDIFYLKVNDNGIGLPKQLDFQSTESLGLQIVVALINQLEGSIELDTDGGAKFFIQFNNIS